MLKIVLDANQFVSALLTRQSNPAKIIDLILAGKLELLLTQDIVAEVETVLQYPRLVKRHKRTPEQLAGFVDRLALLACITPGELDFKIIKDDPEDNKYLTCAIEGKADFIISGDHHLKDLKQFQGVQIVDPDTFLQYYAKR